MIINNNMNILKLGKITSDEKCAFRYLLDKIKDLQCVHCKSKSFYIMDNKRLRCKKCLRDLWPLQNTKFCIARIPVSKWLMLIKLFDLSVSARKASKELEISYNTALRLTTS